MTESNCQYLITKQVLYHLTNRAKIQLVERIGIEPIQSYCCAGDLQSLELTNAQPFQTHFIQMCIIKQTIF